MAKDPNETPRRVALECLGGAATAREVSTLVRLTTLEYFTPTPALGAALRAALVATLERDPRAMRELVPAWRSLGTALRPELLGAVAERGDAGGLELLAYVAHFEDESWHLQLAETALRVTSAAPGPEALEQLETLCILLRSADGVCVQTISSALARARVEAAIPDWIQLLASESRGIRERARRSLEQISGLALGPEAGRWQAWYDAETAWYENEAPDLFTELESEDDARVLAALRVLSTRRLARDELAQEIAPLLQHPTQAVRLCTCSALATLGSAAVVPALVAVLEATYESEDEKTASAVHTTLRTLTELDLPLDPPLWRERLALP